MPQFRKQLCSNDFFQINNIGKTYSHSATSLFEFELLEDDKLKITFDFGEHHEVDIYRLLIINAQGRVIKSFDSNSKDKYTSIRKNACINKYQSTKISLKKGTYLIKYWDNSSTDILYEIVIESIKPNVISETSNLCDRQYMTNGYPRLSPFEETRDRKIDDERFRHHGKRDHMNIIKY